MNFFFGSPSLGTMAINILRGIRFLCLTRYTKFVVIGPYAILFRTNYYYTYY